MKTPLAMAVLLIACMAWTLPHRINAAAPIGAAGADRCSMLKAVTELAQRTRVPLGIEDGPTDCWKTSAPRPAIPGDVQHIDVKQSLAQLVADAPAYEWRDMDGVLVIRPVAAWNDRDHFLTRPVHGFSATERDLSPALAALSEPLTPRRFLASIDIDSIRAGVLPPQRLMGPPPRPDATRPPYVVSFDGGNLLDALNALVRGRESVGWMLNYCDGHATFDTAILTVGLRDESIGRARMVGLWSDHHTNPCLNAATQTRRQF
jgi:hypothetical protein